MEELKKIKKMYGEKFMQLCRNLFPTLLETEGRLYEILTSYFSNNSRALYDDIIKNGLEGDFKNFIYSKIDVENSDKTIIEEKTPYELLDEAGYELTECTTEKEIQKFKKYYKPGEELCTFDGGRLEKCHVFFAVRKDVESIRREDFNTPKREDEYGTSVMGIQFNKVGICTVSIKNRYNHSVNNPDATYGNDLNRIIPGLTQSFERLLKERGLQLNSSNIEEFGIPNYVVANDGKYYKFNMEINGTYYCPGNIVIENGEVHKIENPEKQILMDYFILDLENKTIQSYDQNINDCFTDGLHDIEKIEIVKNKEKGTRRITIQKKGQEEPIIIEIDQENQIREYENSSITHVGDNFLKFNKGLTQLEMPNVKRVGDNFLNFNKGLTQLEMPNVGDIGDSFLRHNESVTQLEMPNVKRVGDDFLNFNKGLTQLNMPNVKRVGDFFLRHNESLTQLEMPNVKRVGDNFLQSNQGLTQLEMPNVMQIGMYFLRNNQILTQLEMPNARNVGEYFLQSNQGLTQLKMPKVTKVGDGFLYKNQGLTQLEMPNATKVGDGFLHRNQSLIQLKMPYIKKYTERLFEIIKQNRTKTKLSENTITEIDGESKETDINSAEIMPVDESKFAQIYGKSKGIIKEVFAKIKSVTKKPNDKIHEENTGERE